MTSIYLERRGRVITEEQRIAQALSGDREAFRHLALQYGPYLYQVVYGVLQSPKDAEDVTQEVPPKCTLPSLSISKEGFKTWITRIAVNKAIDFKRSRRKREELTDDVEIFAGRAGDCADQRGREARIKQGLDVSRFEARSGGARGLPGCSGRLLY